MHVILIHYKAHVWRSDGNLQESALSFTLWDQGTNSGIQSQQLNILPTVSSCQF